MNDTHYAFCVAKIRACESKLLTKQDIASLIEQNDMTSALSLLVQKGYAEENETLNELVERQGKYLEELISDNVPDKKDIEALCLLNDYFNIKVMVKSAVEGIEPDKLFTYPSVIDLKSSERKVSGDFSFLKDKYRTVAEAAYDIALKSRNGKLSDAIIDKAAIDELSRISKEGKSDIFAKVCAFIADTANIKIALRSAASRQDADYINAAVGSCNELNRERLVAAAVGGYDELIAYLDTTCYRDGIKIYTEKPSSFEKWCDDRIIQIASEAKYTSFGFAPVVSYFYKKSIEIKTVRMILSAIKSGADKDKLRERVRALYA